MHVTENQDETIDRLFDYDYTFLIGQMGAGKTVCALTAAQLLIERGHLSRVLVVAPLRVADSVWRHEVEQWDHLDVTVSIAVGTPVQRAAAVETESDILVVNFENLPWLLKQYKNTLGCDGLIIDELDNLRVPGGVTFKSLRLRLKDFTWRVGMTGTPVSENWEGLYAMMLIIDAGAALGKNKDNHLREYFYPTDYEQRNWALKPGAAEMLTARIQENMWVMADYTNELPRLSVDEIPVVMPERATKAYKTLCKDLLFEGVEAANAAVLSGKLEQAASGFLYSDDEVLSLHEAKARAVVGCCEALNEAVIIVYQFEEELRQLRAWFPDAPIMSETKRNLNQVIADWNNGKTPVLLMHPKSGGHGLNLAPGGCRMLWWGPVWSRRLWDQTIARLWRRGQTKPVSVGVVIAQDTIDRVKMNRLEDKGEHHGDFVTHIKNAASA